MRRSLLLTLIALGAIITVIGGAGIFAANTDTARSGTNDVSSAPLAASADIQMAAATQTAGGQPIQCGTFSEDLASGFFSASDVVPGTDVGFAHFCIRNVGSRSVTVEGGVDELNDVDVDCTGDEQLYGDTTCGGNQAGELSDVLFDFLGAQNCDGSGVGISGKTLRTHATTREALGTIAVGATMCVFVKVEYVAGASTDAAKQTAQSDRVTWRYRVDALAG